MRIIKNIVSLKKELILQDKKIVSLVPTMGSLHEGHFALINKAKTQSDIVVVSIFVNPVQFNDINDYKKYPLNLIEDIKKLELFDVDYLFIPESSEIYPKKSLTQIKIESLSNRLCGLERSGHFEGVLLVVIKLINIINPEIAVFGEKDFQQLVLIKQLSKDLNLRTKIISHEIVREANGLAMSSRNLNLTYKQKNIALNLYRILQDIKDVVTKQKCDFNKILQKGKTDLLNIGFRKIGYLEICNEQNLKEESEIINGKKLRIFASVYINEIRLIDNLNLY